MASTPIRRGSLMVTNYVEQLVSAVPNDPIFRSRSGAVFYSPARAWKPDARLYVVGLNPGGDPIGQAAETIERNVAAFRAGTLVSELEVGWAGRQPGAHKYQRSVRQLGEVFGLAPEDIPISNMSFVRSRGEKGALFSDMELCWPLQEAIIRILRPRLIVCCGRKGTQFMLRRLGFDVSGLPPQRLNNIVSLQDGEWKGMAVAAFAHPSRFAWYGRNSTALENARAWLHACRS